MTIEKLEDCIVIDERYTMYTDGVIYDSEGKDIPSWIFEFRDFVTEHADTMWGDVFPE